MSIHPASSAAPTEPMSEHSARILTTADLQTLGQWLAGDHSNWAQAIDNPPFFAHIRVGIRALPKPITPEGLWLYSEQAYDFELHMPYRTAILHLICSDGRIEVHNYHLKNPEPFFGASRNPQKLQEITADVISHLAGCAQWVTRSADGVFHGIIEPGQKCSVVRKGIETYLHSEWTVSANQFSSLDRGYDKNTDEHIWGSIAGPFRFVKKADFSNEVAVN
ncbi:MAG: chromophore lyase CpcT/CpeT [Pseudanabaena sp. ELA607]|jgi:hypothetical protein